MAEEIEFTSNYSDHSTDQGFQFEFNCNRCGTGYRSQFKPSATGTAASVLNAASSIFGGILGRVANISEHVKSAAWQSARDNAFKDASGEIRPSFIQCPRCNAWVCRKRCWNVKNGLCKSCAPDLGVEMAAAQSSKSVEEVWAHAAMAEEDKKLDTQQWRQVIHATCPNCEAPLAANVKFCPSCGAKLNQEKHCTGCGAKLAPNAKFCPECGQKSE